MAQPAVATKPVTVSREELVSRLRNTLETLSDEENCICKIAAEKKVFCKGFARFSDEELRRRYAWIVSKRPNITRAELEAVANDWQLAQQDVRGLPLACDVQRKVNDTCRGWNDFTDEQLAKFYADLTGVTVNIA